MSNNNQQEFTSYTVLESTQSRVVPGAVSKKFMVGVFTWMFVALGISTLFAVLFASNDTLLSYLFSVTEKGAKQLNMLGWLVMLAPIGCVLGMSFAFNRLSSSALLMLFLAYAAINGISFSFILLAYAKTTVIGCFASASIMFGVMALLGYVTDKDLTSFGSLMMMGFAGLFVAIIINLFLHSALLDYIISIIGVAVFLGLTAYDVQKLKRVGAGIEYQGTEANATKKLALMGALTLYIDFVNLFLFMLRLFGGGRKD